MKLYANCSEATFRLDVSSLGENEIDEIQKDLMKLIVEKQEQNADDPAVRIKSNILSQVIDEFNELDYETSVIKLDIFGKNIVVVKGDFPYNNSEDLVIFAEGKGLKYEYEE